MASLFLADQLNSIFWMADFDRAGQFQRILLSMSELEEKEIEKGKEILGNYFEHSVCIKILI